MPQKHKGRYWRSAEDLGMEVRRVDFDPRKPRKPPARRDDRPNVRRAEILPTSMSPSDQDVIYYEPGPPQPDGPPTLPPIRVHHNHNHVTRHDDRERNFFLFLVTVVMSATGGLAGFSLAVGFGLPRWPSAGLCAALVTLPTLAFILGVASRDPEIQRHITERRQDRFKAQLQRERAQLEDARENRRIDIEAQTATEEAKLAREQALTEQRQAQAAAERARTDRARIIEQARRHSRPQSTNNQLANYVSADGEADGSLQEAEPLIADPTPLQPTTDLVRTRMLETLAELYDPDAGRVEKSGLVANGYKLPWTKRGGLTQSQRKRALDIIRQLHATGAPLFTYQEEQRRWALNVRRYPTLESAIDALDQTRTRA